MLEVLVRLEEIRADLTDESVEEVEAKKHLDALAYWIAEHDRKARAANAVEGGGSWMI